MFFLIFFRTCQHDEEFRDFKPFVQKPKKPYKKLMDENKNIYSPIRSTPRFIFNTTALRPDINEPMRCTRGGQVINWGGTNVVCQDSDVITEQKYNVIMETFNNLEDYLTSMMKVTPLEEPIQLLSSYNSFLQLNGGETIYDCDMHFKIVARPYGSESTILASATALQQGGPELRPIQGIIFINIAKVPLKSQTYSDIPNEFFGTCFHEICHAFGVSQHYYEQWLNKETGKPYGEDLPLTRAVHRGKTFTILQTPSAHKYARKRFGKETFTFGDQEVKAGIELEDGGGSGTATSHPEGRVYFGEVMAGVATSDSTISDLSFALLEDTGWYDVNYSYARGHIWGNGLAYTGEPFTEFPDHAPQTSFPANHLCHPPEREKCTYDYKAIGVCMYNEFTCDGTENLNISDPSTFDEHQTFCTTQDFLNPMNYDQRGNSAVHDYMMFITQYSNKDCLNPDTYVSDNKNEKAGPNSRCIERSGGSLGCFETRCQGLNLYVKIGANEYLCSQEGQRVGPLFSKVKCPPPEVICRGMAVNQFFTSDPFNLSYTPELLYMSSIGSPGSVSSIVVYACIGAIALTFLIVLIALIVTFTKRKPIYPDHEHTPPHPKHRHKNGSYRRALSAGGEKKKHKKKPRKSSNKRRKTREQSA